MDYSDKINLLSEADICVLEQLEEMRVKCAQFHTVPHISMFLLGINMGIPDELVFTITARLHTLGLIQINNEDRTNGYLKREATITEEGSLLLMENPVEA